MDATFDFEDSRNLDIGQSMWTPWTRAMTKMKIFESPATWWLLRDMRQLLGDIFIAPPSPPRPHRCPALIYVYAAASLLSSLRSSSKSSLLRYLSPLTSSFQTCIDVNLHHCATLLSSLLTSGGQWPQLRSSLAIALT